LAAATVYHSGTAAVAAAAFVAAAAGLAAVVDVALAEVEDTTAA
jgi:hypothetical protein